MTQDIKEYINTILRPMAKADGGDMVCVAVENHKLILHAHGDCATCNSCGDDMTWWLNQRLEKIYGRTFTIEIIKIVPYFDK